MKRYVSRWAPVCALIGISLALISCAKNTSSNQDGLPSPESTVSSITTGYNGVVMVILPGGSGICTGTFVHPKMVVTAAHCTKNSGMYRVQGSFGTASTYTKRNFGPGVVDDPNDLSALIFDTEVVSAADVYAIGNTVRTGDTVRLVGYGCNDLTKKTGAGTKRTGTNSIFQVNDYVEFLTPKTNAVAILGPSNRAGSCFGDSGGPALSETESTSTLVAVTHAGGYYGDSILSQYVDLTRTDNRNFLSGVATEFGLTVQGL